MTRSAKHYVFTLNNWTADELDHIAQFVDLLGATYCIVGRERGENDTPHLQGFISFDRRRTFAFVRDAFRGRAHVEVKRGTVSQAIAYCKKDGDYDEWGNPPDEQGHRSDIEAFKEWLQTLDAPPTDEEIALEHTALWFKSRDRCMQLAKIICPDVVLERDVPRAWQDGLIRSLEGDADPREVLFYYDRNGNIGKSWCVRKLLSVYPRRVQVLGIGRKVDLAYSIDPEKDIFVFDVHRGGMEFLQYGILENLKDRVVYSAKYDSQMKILKKVPHVVVFSNELPDMNKMTLDRFHVIDEFNN